MVLPSLLGQLQVSELASLILAGLSYIFVAFAEWHMILLSMVSHPLVG